MTRPGLARTAMLAGVVLSSTLGLAIPMLVGPGCLTCTKDDCSSTFTVAVTETDGGPLGLGHWDFELVVDGETLLAACEIGPQSRTVDCEPGDLDVTALPVTGPGDPLTRFHIGFREGAGSGSPGVPEALHVTVVHRGDVVIDEPFEPRYELVKPERCDPDCVEDTANLVAARD